jgi:hypothetical protein
VKRPGKWLFVFCAVQCVGVICMWVWPHTLTGSSFFWGTALLLLFPGNFLSALIVEKFLWQSRLSLTAIAVIEVPLLVAINMALWWGVIRCFRRLMPRRAD